ncbi:MAG: permease [Planctomycetota bacterium]|nr:permease [Planctomycetota bacterium]
MMDWVLLADGPGFTGLLSDFNTMFWSGVLRIFEAIIAAAPYLVSGAFAAGILRGMVGAERLQRLLAVHHWSSPLRAWAFGILLPVCSLGALPIARELRRAGVPSGTVLSFVLVAPVLNPVSIIYGLSHIEPVMLIYFAIGTFIISIGIGLLWNRLISAERDTQPEQLERPPVDSLQRLQVVGTTAARSVFGRTCIDYALALLAVGFLGAFLPHAVLSSGLTRDNIFAPALMGIVAIPVYVTPTEVMMHFGHIVRDGFSLGAAFALIVLGAGANVGVANWLRRDYGFRPLMLFVCSLIGATLLLGVTADRSLPSGAATQQDHTHAFDSFTRLSSVPARDANPVWVFKKVWTESSVTEIYGLELLAILMVCGFVLFLAGDRLEIESIMLATKQASATELTSPKWDPALSTGQLAAATITGVLALSTLGLYLFYPAKEEILDDLINLRFGVREAVANEDLPELQRQVRLLRTQVQKLPTSARIRFQTVTEEQQKSVEELLYSLKTIENYANAGKFTQASFMLNYFEKTYMRCSSAFREAKPLNIPTAP